MTNTGIPATGRFEIRIEGSSTVLFQIQAPDVEGYVIGRSDASSSYQPDIDLVNCQALERGVSRRHAVLLRYKGLMHIIDLSSVNGTFINGRRLDPDIPYVLNLGDSLRLGSLNLSLIKIM